MSNFYLQNTKSELSLLINFDLVSKNINVYREQTAKMGAGWERDGLRV